MGSTAPHEQWIDSSAGSRRGNGIGLPNDMLSTVFALFTQVDSSLEESRGGLGIGLTLVRRIVEMHGGSIEARSSGLTEGSEFIVRIPLDIPSRQESAPTPATSPSKTLNRCRILVVDDNKDAADSLAILLRVHGNDVRIAYDGLEAAEAAEVFHPEVALLDIGLPKMNGYDLARSIRQQPWARDVTLVALA